MPKITEPLRLAVGSHEAGSGEGCAMNVISWETGEATITDYPACASKPLAALVQWVNDAICGSTRIWRFPGSGPFMHKGTLCPECSTIALELGHLTIGTAGMIFAVTFSEYKTIARKIDLLGARLRRESSLPQTQHRTLSDGLLADVKSLLLEVRHVLNLDADPGVQQTVVADAVKNMLAVAEVSA